MRFLVLLGYDTDRLLSSSKPLPGYIFVQKREVQPGMSASSR